MVYVTTCGLRPPLGSATARLASPHRCGPQRKKVTRPEVGQSIGPSNKPHRRPCATAGGHFKQRSAATRARAEGGASERHEGGCALRLRGPRTRRTGPLVAVIWGVRAKSLPLGKKESAAAPPVS